MEKVREQEEMALDESGALQVRQRRRGVNFLEEKRKVVEAGVEGEQRSVYYDEEQGVQITAEAALMKLYNEDQFAAEKDVANVKVDFRTKEFHGQEDVPVQEANNALKNTKVENGSTSQHYSEGYNENEITQGQHEIDRDKGIKIVKKSELKLSDVDLERVLGEQDTHDLYCPNCRSCITRKVILRKRKRSERNTEETESDSYEGTDPDDREPDLFRCLSCFSFFIPTDGGFNIFRIFGKREENQQHRSSQQTSETITHLPFSKRQERTTLPKESDVRSNGQTEDQSQKYKWSTVAQPAAEATLDDRSQWNNEEKHCHTILNNDRGIDFFQDPEKGIRLVPADVIPPHFGLVPEPEQGTGEAQIKNDWDVLKSIVYGGLIESVTSLSVVSSAAGTDASTLKIVALGLANLIGGFFVLVQNLFELRNTQDEATDQEGEPAGRYWEVLGRKENFKLHATVAILSYLIFGIMPPLIYGFSFQGSDYSEYKLIAVAAAGLLCISLLAIGKAHVKPQKPYIKYLLSYLGLGVSTSGLSYVAGLMIMRLLEKLGLFDSNTSATALPSIIYRDLSSTVPAWSSY